MLLFATMVLITGAQTTEACRSARPGDELIVMLLPSGDRWAEQARQAICSQLSDLPAVLEQEVVDGPSGALANMVPLARKVARRRRARVVLWVEPGTLKRLFLYVADKHAERLFVRRVGSEGTGRLGRIEASALLTRSFVDAWLGGADLGRAETIAPPVEPEEPDAPKPPPPPPPVTQPAEPTQRHIELAATYGVRASSPQQLLGHGPGASALLRLGQWAQVGVSFDMTLPRILDGEGWSVEVISYSLQLVALHRWWMSDFSFDAGVAAGLDRAEWRVTAKDARLTENNELGRWQFVAGLRSRGSFHLTPATQVFLSPVAEIVPNERPLVIVRPSGNEIVSDVWWWRVGLRLGFAWAPL